MSNDTQAAPGTYTSLDNGLKRFLNALKYKRDRRKLAIKIALLEGFTGGEQNERVEYLLNQEWFNIAAL